MSHGLHGEILWKENAAWFAQSGEHFLLNWMVLGLNPSQVQWVAWSR